MQQNAAPPASPPSEVPAAKPGAMLFAEMVAVWLTQRPTPPAGGK